MDYFGSRGNLDWQHQWFERYIEAAVALKKTLIIHTRDSAEETINSLKNKGYDSVGGFLHCFTEDWGIAQLALDIGFYIFFKHCHFQKRTADSRSGAKSTIA